MGCTWQGVLSLHLRGGTWQSLLSLRLLPWHNGRMRRGKEVQVLALVGDRSHTPLPGRTHGGEADTHRVRRSATPGTCLDLKTHNHKVGHSEASLQQSCSGKRN